jgi:hypothetical protein
LVNFPRPIIAYAKLQGVYFGEQALNALGLGKFVLSTHGVQPVEGVNAMGLPALTRARAAGATDSEIITYAKLQGVYFGEQALNALRLGKFVLSTHGTQIVNGVNSMGLSAVNRARGAGLTDTEIKAYAKLKGVYFGVEALRSLGL